MKLMEIIELAENKYLNMYKLKLINRKGNPKDYFMVSRRKKDNLVCMTKNHDVCDGVMILPITEDDEIVILKQYRPVIGDYLYELPAGMVDPGESMEEAAKRELFEETGLKAKSYEVILKPSYTSVGITDETTAIVKMVVEGEVDTSNIEDDEDIEVIKVKKSEANEFARTHNMSIKGALMLMAINEF